MPPSSLIFVVILAVWGAYLVQHWVRRRDHIATARSVDRFSEAMRVLERRQQTPAPGAHPVPRSYAVSPIRRAVAEPVEEVVAAAPEPASRVTAARAMAGAAAGRAAAGSAGVGRAARAGARTAASGARSARDGARSAVSPLSPIRRRSAMLLVGSTAMVLGTVLGLVGVWPWWTAAAGIAAFLLAGALVRWSVRRSRPATSTARRRRRPGPNRSASRRPGRPTVATRPVPGGLSRPELRRGSRPDAPGDSRPEARPHGRPALAPGEVVARPARPTTRTAAVGGAAAALAARRSPTATRSRPVTAVYDIDAVEGRTAAPPATPGDGRRRQGPAAPGSWDPVPVPPPTYTLKAKATPRAAEQAPPVLPAAVSTPPEELPFDGLALAFAEESEELPAVRTQP